MQISKEEIACLQRVMDAVGAGCRTFRVAERLGMSTATARRLLQRMEHQGHVRRNAQYTASNDIYWETTPTNPQEPRHDR